MMKSSVFHLEDATQRKVKVTWYTSNRHTVLCCPYTVRWLQRKDNPSAPEVLAITCASIKKPLPKLSLPLEGNWNLSKW